MFLCYHRELELSTMSLVSLICFPNVSHYISFFMFHLVYLALFVWLLALTSITFICPLYISQIDFSPLCCIDMKDWHTRFWLYVNSRVVLHWVIGEEDDYMLQNGWVAKLFLTRSIVAPQMSLQPSSVSSTCVVSIVALFN